MWSNLCWNFSSIRRTTSYDLRCFPCFLFRELNGSTFGPWNFKSTLSSISYTSICMCWSLFCTFWIQKRTIGLDVAYLVVVETDTHSLVTISAVMSFLATLESYQIMTRFFIRFGETCYNEDPSVLQTLIHHTWIFWLLAEMELGSAYFRFV